MTTKHEVLACFDAHPDWTSGQLAREIGCDPAYVRETLTRNGRRLKNSKPGSKLDARKYTVPRVTKERERCAALAERMGAPLVAQAIRSGVEP